MSNSSQNSGKRLELWKISTNPGKLGGWNKRSLVRETLQLVRDTQATTAGSGMTVPASL